MITTEIARWWRRLWCPHTSRQTAMPSLATWTALLEGRMTIEEYRLLPEEPPVTKCYSCGKVLRCYALYVTTSPMWENDQHCVVLDDSRILHFATNQLRYVGNGTFNLKPPPDSSAVARPYDCGRCKRSFHSPEGVATHVCTEP